MHDIKRHRSSATAGQRTVTCVESLLARLLHFNGTAMNISLSLGPLVSLLAGILILVLPRLLNYIVAIYLILMGLFGLFGAGAFHLK